jgi:tetratricopeptide (TPR) repeat protein
MFVLYTFYNFGGLAMFKLCFEKQNVLIDGDRWLYKNRSAGRFEWLALLAIRRVRRPSDAWVSLDEIARLPNWSRKTGRGHMGGNIARYLVALQKHGFRVDTEERWVGPYRLHLAPSEIVFDISIEQAENRLQLGRTHAPISRGELYRFTDSYARAQWLFFQGKSLPSKERGPNNEGAHHILNRMADNDFFCPRLRLLASISAVQVLFQLGRFQAAGKTLEDKVALLPEVNDDALTATFLLELAWSRQRSASGALSNRLTDEAINRARGFAERAGDRASFARLAYRMSGFLTKKGQHRESIDQLLLAIEAVLITGNFYELQAYCIDLGSVIHRLGPKFYLEAQEWILLGIEIGHWMGYGHDNPHGEVILGKTYAEQGDAEKARHWLQIAETIAAQSGNPLTLADAKMVWGFWHQRFGTPEGLIITLVEALKLFRSLRKFDCPQKERYMARKFPSVWPTVIERIN